MTLNLPVNNTDAPEDYVGAWRKPSNVSRNRVIDSQAQP